MRLGQGDGAKTTIWTGGSRTILSFVHAAKRRKRAVAIGGGVTVVVAATVAFVALRYSSAQMATRVVESYGALSQCLLGEPLKEAERAGVRFRAMQLTALGTAELARASGEVDWPERCAPHAHQLNDSLSKTDLGDGEGKALVVSSRVLAEALEAKGSYFADLSPAIDKAFDDARAARIVRAAAPGIAAPPNATSALNVDTTGDAARLSTEQLELGALVLERHRSGTVRFLATADTRKSKPVSCTFRADTAECTPFPKSISEAAAAGLTLLGTADEEAAALAYAAKGVQGIFRSDNGAPFDAANAIGGYTAVDGFTAVLALDGQRLELLRTDGDKVRTSAASPRGRLTVLRPERDAQLLWGHVLFATHDDGKYALAAAPVDPKRGLGDMEEVGALGEEQAAEAEAAKGPRIDGCRSAQALVARVRVGRLSYLSFRLGNRWTKPVKVGPAGGALSCHKKQAVITQIGSQGGTPLTSTITQHVCSPTACQTKTTVMSDVLTGAAGLAPSVDISAVGLDGKVLLVWQAGQRGGLRMRLAALSNLSKTPDVVLFDGHMAGGAVVATSTVLTQRVLPAEGYALVLINTSSGVFALRVTADGKHAPATISQ